MSTKASSPTIWQKHFENFDIDNYFKHITPRPRLYILPRPISHWLGYRLPHDKPQPKLAQPFVWLSALLGGFIGIAIISNVYLALPHLDGHQVPVIIASFGAAAILEYNAIESPLAQPRNIIFGHFLSALIGVAITKGFERLPVDRFENLEWLAGAISVGVASAVMSITKTVHPPAGATALLASTSPDITVLGWWLLPLVLLGSSLMTVSALVVNNLTRRWPVYWWTPMDLSKKNPKEDIEHVQDIEEEDEVERQSIESEPYSLNKVKSRHIEHADGRSESEATLNDDYEDSKHANQGHDTREHQILITHNKIVLPDWIEVSSFEKELLETFRQKLQQGSSGQNTES